jgi:hypothetical protein
MLRIVLLALAAVLYVTSVQAHGVHAGCRVGDSWMGVVPHFHPGGYGQAVACGGGGGGGGYGRPTVTGPGYYGGGGYGRGPMGPRNCGPGMNSDGYRCVPIVPRRYR